MDQGEAATQLLMKLADQPDPVNTARVALAQGRLARLAGRHEGADAAYGRALALLRAQAQPSAQLLATALTGQAGALIALNKAGGLDRGQALLDEAQALLERAGATASYADADVAYQRTMLAYARDDWDTSLRMARREREIIQRIAGPNAAAQLDALATLAALTSSLRRYDETLGFVAEGRRLARLAPGASRHAYLGILNTESVVLLDLGRPTQALAVADEALALAVQAWGAGSVATLTPLDRRARAEEALQRHLQARRSHAEILAVLAGQAGQVAIARRLRLLDTAAGFHLRLNDLDTAQRLADEGLALTPPDGTLKYWRGRFLRRAAMLAGAEGRWAEAAELHGRALPLMLVALKPSSPYITGSHAMRCEAQTRAALDAGACLALEARLAALTDAAPSERVLARRALAEQAAQAGRRSEARAHELHALAAAQSAESQGQLWRVLGRVAASLREAGERDLAVLLAKAAVEQVEAVRDQFDGAGAAAAEFESDYLADKYALYRRSADWLAADGRANEALALIRLLKGEEFSDFVRGHADTPHPRESAMPWRDGERRWLAASPLAAAVPERGFTRQSMAQIAALEDARRQAWQQALQRAVPASAGDATAPLPAPAAGALVATLFLGDQHLNLHLRWAAGQELIRLPLDPRALRRDIGQLLTLIERREHALPLLQSLYQRLAAPIDRRARALRATQWQLRLDGELRYLPFAALHDGNAYLVERYAIQQLATPGPAPQAATRRPWLQAFGAAREAGLPGVRSELCGIVQGEVTDGRPGAGACPAGATRGAMPGRAWLDGAFTADQLRLALQGGREERFDILHIGSHFTLRPGEVGRSWLMLGDGQRLSLNELLGWRLASQELVTLSACQTGVGGGAEVEGLAGLLLRQGAASVVASLWPVDDASTSLLMRQMYQALAGHADPVAALRQAQLRTLRSGSPRLAHPQAWAGFFVSAAALRR